MHRGMNGSVWLPCCSQATIKTAQLLIQKQHVINQVREDGNQGEDLQVVFLCPNLRPILSSTLHINVHQPDLTVCIV